MARCRCPNPQLVGFAFNTCEYFPIFECKTCYKVYIEREIFKTVGSLKRLVAHWKTFYKGIMIWVKWYP